MAGNLRKAAELAGNKTRIQNSNTAGTVKASAGNLYQMVLTNANVAAQSLTILDGASTVGVYWCPTKDTRSLAFNVPFSTSLIVTPSSVDIDVLIMWD